MQEGAPVARLGVDFHHKRMSLLLKVLQRVLAQIAPTGKVYAL
jgi:hypothetical protein